MSSKFRKNKRVALQGQAKKDRRLAKHAIDKALRKNLPAYLNNARSRRVIVDGLGKRQALKIRREKTVGGAKYASEDGGITWTKTEGGAA